MIIPHTWNTTREKADTGRTLQSPKNLVTGLVRKKKREFIAKLIEKSLTNQRETKRERCGEL